MFHLLNHADGTPRAVHRDSGETLRLRNLRVDVSPCACRGANHRWLPGRRKAGRAEYDKLWWCGGGGGWMPTFTEKNDNMDVGVFFFLADHGYGRGLFLPL